MVDFNVEGYPYVIFTWLWFALATPFVCVRLYVQIKIRSRPWREIFVLVAWLCFLCWSIGLSLENSFGIYAGHGYFDDHPDDYVKEYKTEIATGLTYKQIVYCCKASLLILYSDMTPRNMRGIRWAIRVNWVAIALGILIQLGFVLARCVHKGDDGGSVLALDMKTSCPWKAYDDLPVIFTGWALHLTTDISVYILPFFILRGLPLGRKQKHTAIIMFSLGFINILSAFILTIDYMITWTYEVNPNWYIKGRALYWFMLPLQAGSAIIIVCVPYMKRFWKGTGTKDLQPGCTRSKLASAIRAIGHKPMRSDIEATVDYPSEKKEDRVAVGVYEVKN